MMGIGFLGYLNIAQNDYNKKTTKIFNNKRHYSTLRNPDRIKNFLTSKNLNPVFVYDNLDKDSVRKDIVKETKGLSGIYMILNKETLSYYIGSASTGRINSRFTNHLIYFNGSKVIKNSVKKYGLHNFCFFILELFPEVVNQENNKKLLDLEDFYLKSLLPDYNILTEAGSSFGYKHTEITRIKMRSNYSKSRREQIENLTISKSISPQGTMSEENIKYSKEGILCASYKKKNSKPIVIKELNGIIYGKFPSIIAGAEALNCSYKTVYRALNSPSKQLKGR
jgi:group I intron endonuclease